MSQKSPRVCSPDEVIDAFRKGGKRVLTFVGYGELGYECPEEVNCIVRQQLVEHEPAAVVVNCGTLLREGGLDGIAAVYGIAKNMGFRTTGIHPSVALGYKATHIPSPLEDEVFFVEDRTWGGFLPGGRELSPTLKVLVTVSDGVVVIGGGRHAADEMEAFLQYRVPLRYFPARMNPTMASTWGPKAEEGFLDPMGSAFWSWKKHLGEVPSPGRSTS